MKIGWEWEFKDRAEREFIIRIIHVNSCLNKDVCG